MTNAEHFTLRLAAIVGLTPPSVQEFYADHLLRLLHRTGVPGVCPTTIPFILSVVHADANEWKRVSAAARDLAKHDRRPPEDLAKMEQRLFELFLGYGIDVLTLSAVALLRNHGANKFSISELRQQFAQVREQALLRL